MNQNFSKAAATTPFGSNDDDTSIVDYDENEEEDILTVRGSDHARSSAAAIDIVKVVRGGGG